MSSSCGVVIDERGYPAAWDDLDGGESSSYLELHASGGGGSSTDCNGLLYNPETDLWEEPFDEARADEVIIEDILKRSECCGKTMMRYSVIGSKNEHYAVGDGISVRMLCAANSCPVCGRKNSIIHKRRVRRLTDKIEKHMPLDEVSLKQFVFTIPDYLRVYFRSSERIKQLKRLAVKCIKKYLPSDFGFVTFHGTGNETVGEYKPHVNVQCIKKRGSLMKLDLSVLKSIKDTYLMALKGLLNVNIEKVDVHYKFKTYTGGVINSLNYMTRPCPSYDDLEEMKKNDRPMFNIFVRDLRRFKTIDYFGKWEGVNEKRTAEAEYRSLKGVKLKYEGKMKSSEFFEYVRGGDCKEIRPGVYHYRTYEDIQKNGHLKFLDGYT